VRGRVAFELEVAAGCWRLLAEGAGRAPCSVCRRRRDACLHSLRRPTHIAQVHGEGPPPRRTRTIDGDGDGANNGGENSSVRNACKQLRQDTYSLCV
jgi:hypothetical protein